MDPPLSCIMIADVDPARYCNTKLCMIILTCVVEVSLDFFFLHTDCFKVCVCNPMHLWKPLCSLTSCNSEIHDYEIKISIWGETKLASILKLVLDFFIINYLFLVIHYLLIETTGIFDQFL